MDEPWWLSQAFLTGVAVFVAPLFGIIAAVIASKRSQKNTQSIVAVSATDATTNQFNALVAGFNQSFVNMKEEIAGLKTRVATVEAEKTELGIRVGTLEGEKAQLMDRVETLENEKDELIAHVVVLENLIPDPPGIPERPRPWMRRVNRPKGQPVSNP